MSCFDTELNCSKIFSNLCCRTLRHFMPYFWLQIWWCVHRKTCPHLSLRTPLGRRGPGIRCSRYASVEIATWNVQTWNTLHKTGILYLGKRKIIDSKVSSKGILMKVTPWKIDMEPTNHPFLQGKMIWTKPPFSDMEPSHSSSHLAEHRSLQSQAPRAVANDACLPSHPPDDLEEDHPSEELPWEHTASFIFRGYNGYSPYLGGVKPCIFHGFGVQGWLITMISKSPKEWVVGPLPNGLLDGWEKWGLPTT